ncbi:MAG TPA: HlyD family secretion protein [Xanthobacteraceae bacterium]|nr:HlyD family secretion protein [Xanthobacteraceae bacterium]
MAEPSLKVVPDTPAGTDTPASGDKPSSKLSRGRLRTILLIVVPAIAVLVGGALYLGSGRYISTDNAYVGAQKVLITPDISGKIARVTVHEGQHVKAGDALFAIDPQPFQLAVDQAKAKLTSVRTDFANLKTNLRSLDTLVDLGKRNVELKQRDVDRKQTLAKTHAGSQSDLDAALAALVTAKLQAQFVEQQRDNSLNQLLGKPDLPIEQFPAYQQAQAALAQAERDLDHTVLRAPIDGMATQVDNIQLGRFVVAGTPVFAVIDDSAPWVDANPKETDITYLKVGQRVQVDVDTFPDHTFHGTVQSVSPGTGAQFAILPPQNASGNWVKVVQRVPVRIRLDRDPMNRNLRAGMSTTVEIDTGRSWFGSTAGRESGASTKSAAGGSADAQAKPATPAEQSKPS